MMKHLKKFGSKAALKFLLCASISTFAIFLAEKTAYASAWWVFYQPKMPKSLLKK